MNPQRIAQLRELMASDPADPFLPYAIAQELVAGDEWEEACTLYAHLVEAHPRYLPTYYQYGVALVRLDRLEQGIEVLRQGLGLARRVKDGKTANELEALLDDLE